MKWPTRGKAGRFARLPALCAVAMLCAGLAVGAEGSAPGPREPVIGSGPDVPYRTVHRDDIPILQTIVIPRSENYTIDDHVIVDGYFYTFTVHCPHGTYQVVSVRNLIKLCHEIDVLEHFRKEEHGSHFAAGVGESVKNVGKGAVNVVRHPGVAIKKVGHGLGRFGRLLASPFREDKPVLASDGTDRSLLGRGPAGGERRLLAYELGLDVYTYNPNVQELLNSVARSRLAGKLPVGATIFALPGGSVFTLSLTPMGHDQSTEELIRDKGPFELRRELAIRYERQFGLEYGPEKAPLTKLLDNPNYSPREQAYLYRYLLDLREVDGVERAVEFLGAVSSPEKAGIVSTQVELLSLLHKRAKPMAQFVPVRNTLGARSRDGTLCLVISIDTVRFWSDVITSLKLSIQAAREAGAERIEFWSTGDIDQKSVEASRSMGVAVHQNILENPLFRRPREPDVARGRR